MDVIPTAPRLDSTRSEGDYGTPTARARQKADQSDAVGDRLASVEWDFIETLPRESIHDLHPYPARFIPELPRALIRLFHPGDETAVLDPFCGCGTTLFESVAAGLPGIGIDLNPLAVLISQVKTRPLTEPLLPLAQNISSGRASENVTVPAIPRLDHWFQANVQRALSVLTAGINGVSSSTSRDALRVALSRIIVRVSNQDSDTRYAAVAKDVQDNDVYDLFLRSVETVEAALNDAYGGLFAYTPDVTVKHVDALLLKPSDFARPIGLVVTSPPYPNAYEYWLYHKYRMYWLGMDPIALREGEIGARPHYFKKNHQTELDFQLQMNQLFKVLAQVLAPGRFACFVVGRSIIHGRTIDNLAILRGAAARSGFVLAGTAGRTIARNRKSFNLSHAAIADETIAVFERSSSPS